MEPRPARQAQQQPMRRRPQQAQRPLTEAGIRRTEAADFKRQRKAAKRAEIAAKGGFQ